MSKLNESGKSEKHHAGRPSRQNLSERKCLLGKQKLYSSLKQNSENDQKMDLDKIQKKFEEVT